MMERTFFVAELSGNHNGIFERAIQLIDEAAKAGASAIKLQTYKPETMTIDFDDFAVSREHELWGGKKLFDLYREAMTPWEWHSELFSRARNLGLTAFSSPFDHTAVDFLESLDCQVYKIASLETSDTDLIKYVASTGKPIIISTGASNLKEIARAIEVVQSVKNEQITLLVCTSAYPTYPMDAHVRRITFLHREFGLPIGFSDHTLGVGASIAAIALGAKVIEKHLTLSRDHGGHDAAFSLEPAEFATLVREGGIAKEALGQELWINQDSEEESRRLRRSLYVITKVKKGEIASRDNIGSRRPNKGGDIDQMGHILGRKFKDDYPAGTAATIDIVN